MQKILIVAAGIAISWSPLNLVSALADPPVRACDTYIAKYCSGSSDHGPGCLKDHVADVSDACKNDIEHKGPPHGGPPESSSTSNSKSE